MLRSSLVLLLILSMPALASAQEGSSAGADWLRLARAALAAQRYEEAASDLANASSATTPGGDAESLASAWADLGDAFVLRGAPDRAVPAYGAALLLVPSSASFRVARGWAFAAQGDAARARGEIAIARRIDPVSADALALERGLDEVASLRMVLFVTGGVAIGVGVVGALLAAIIGAVLRTSATHDDTPYHWSIGSGTLLAVLGIVTVSIADALHVGSIELPRRGAQPIATWLPGGGLLGLRTSF